MPTQRSFMADCTASPLYAPKPHHPHVTRMCWTDYAVTHRDMLQLSVDPKVESQHNDTLECRYEAGAAARPNQEVHVLQCHAGVGS